MARYPHQPELGIAGCPCTECLRYDWQALADGDRPSWRAWVAVERPARLPTTCTACGRVVEHRVVAVDGFTGADVRRWCHDPQLGVPAMRCPEGGHHQPDINP